VQVILGHQAVGLVMEMGDGVSNHTTGDRVGMGWIHSSTGEADESFSHSFSATGW
tara:strand:- start:1919 stop:2083 length:165 start_codon:yes stop_codon:yes gene_type:complete